MNAGYIVAYVLLGVLFSLFLFSVYYKKWYYTYILIGIAILCSVVIFVLIWREDYNVHPESDNQNIKKKIAWINVDKLDILNREHVKWSRDVLIKQAPNKLGIYSDKYNVTTLDILRYKEVFYEMFGYNSEYIYFENAKLNKKTRDFCKEKDLKISRISLRINNK